MEQAVERVQQNLIVELYAQLRRSIARDAWTNENLAVGKGNDVGLGRIVEEIAVNTGHGGAVDQNDVDLGEIFRERARQQRQRRLKPPPKRTDLDCCYALLV